MRVLLRMHWNGAENTQHVRLIPAADTGLWNIEAVYQRVRPTNDSISFEYQDGKLREVNVKPDKGTVQQFVNDLIGKDTLCPSCRIHKLLFEEERRMGYCLYCFGMGMA